MIRIAVLDDYQGIAASLADWASLGANVVFFRDHVADVDTLAGRLAEFDVVCPMRERAAFPKPLIDRLPKLKFIATTGRGNAAIDIAACAARGIPVSGTNGHGSPTAELTWGLILALARQIPAADRDLRGGGWQRSVGTMLEGRTLGCLGLGRLGSRVAKVGLAFGMKVIAWSQNLDAAKAESGGARLVDKATLFAESDVLSIHLVLSARTRGLVSATDLSRMKPTAFLVNTSRGPIVDEAALVAALREKRIAGAGLDVFDVEPLPTRHPLRALDNVVLTPHLGYVVRETMELFYRETVENIQAWMDGRPKRVIAR